MPTGIETSIRVIWGLLIRAVALVGGGYLLYRVRSVLLSVMIAVLLTYALLPFVDWLCRRNVRSLRPKTQRLLATVLVFIIFIGLTVTTVTIIVTPFTEELTRFSANLQQYSGQLRDLAANAGKWYTKAVPSDVKDLIGNLDYASIGKSVTGYFKGLIEATRSWIGFALEIVLIPVLAFYFVLDYRTLSREFYGLVPKPRRREALRIGHEAGAIMQSYIVGQAILCLLAGALTAVFLSVLEMPYVVVLALFSGITRAIPIVGPVVSGIPIVLVGILNFTGLAVPVYLLVFVVVMHFAESKFIMPYLIGDRLRLHPALVIIVLLIGAEFFGIVGMFLAAPVAAMVRELVRLYYIAPRKRALDAECASRESALAGTEIG